jgi:antitoxin FitA
MPTTLTIELSEERLERLRKLAQKAGVTPEELAQARLGEWLEQSEEEFQRAAQYVLRKNAELYRRLV